MIEFNWQNYKGNLSWLPFRTFLLVRSGSHAYGTNIPTSDIDIKGIAVPPIEYFHGYLNIFEQAEGHDPDITIYDIRKYFRLAVDCNPNIIELLWTDEDDRYETVCKSVAQLLIENRNLFISRKAKHTFSGYAMSQLKRINTHRRWLLHPPSAPPTREDFGLPNSSLVSSDDRQAAEALILKQVESWDVDLEPLPESSRIAMQNHISSYLAEIKVSTDEKWNAAARTLGFSENFIEVMARERAYRSKQKEWEQYQEWKKNRNPSRAKMESDYGYDLKHAMHLVRLLRMAREILTTGKVVVKRPDAEELLSIRNGAWTFDQLIEWAEKQDKDLEEIVKTSILPHSPDRKKLDNICQKIVDDFI